MLSNIGGDGAIEIGKQSEKKSHLLDEDIEKQFRDHFKYIYEFYKNDFEELEYPGLLPGKSAWIKMIFMRRDSFFIDALSVLWLSKAEL